MRKKPLKLRHVIGIILLLLYVVGSISELFDTSSSSKSYSSAYGSGYAHSSSPSKPAMTKETAEALKGTGYKGTRPNSWAENHALKCAQIKCDVCGMHTDNGVNSACDSCQAKGYR